MSIESGVMGHSGPKAPPLRTKPSITLDPIYSEGAERPEPLKSKDNSGTQTPESKSEGKSTPEPSAAMSIKDGHGVAVKHLSAEADRPKHVDEENIFDATPRVKQQETGDSSSQGISEVSRATTVDTVARTKSKGKGKADAAQDPVAAARGSSHTAELPDSSEEYQRTMRLQSQEEKIFYEPEDEAPKMVATSYPGQEWNPYGEFDLGGDWEETKEVK
jgi:hypothetical protein